MKLFISIYPFFIIIVIFFFFFLIIISFIRVF